MIGASFRSAIVAHGAGGAVAPSGCQVAPGGRGARGVLFLAAALAVAAVSWRRRRRAQPSRS
jgi:MYXO-CTERM domain-containing protein